MVEGNTHTITTEQNNEKKQQTEDISSDQKTTVDVTAKKHDTTELDEHEKHKHTNNSSHETNTSSHHTASSSSSSTTHKQHNAKSTSKKGSDEEDDFSIDFQTMKQSALKFVRSPHVKKYAFLLLLIIPLFLALWVRMLPADLPVTDTWAQSTVDNNLRNQVRQAILQETPNLPQQALNEEVNRRLQQEIQNNRAAYENSIAQLSQMFKDRLHTDDGQRYISDIDSYHYYRQAYNVVENGYPGNILKDGEPFDTTIRAPLGKQEVLTFSAVAGAFLISSLANFGIGPFQAFNLLPVVFGTLAIIPIFFIGRRIAGNLAGFFAAMVIAVMPTVVAKTAFGNGDTDVFNIFFPLLIVWLVIEAYSYRETFVGKLISVVAGLSIGLYSFAWIGWWYIFDVLLIAILFVALYLPMCAILKKQKIFEMIKKEKSFYISSLIFFISSCVSVLLFTSSLQLSKFITGPAAFLRIDDVVRESIFPNVLTTVAELNAVSISAVISQLGGVFLVLIALIGIFCLFFEGKLLSNKDYFVVSAVAVYFFLLVRSSFTQFIFTALLALPFVLFIGWKLYLKQRLNFLDAIILLGWVLSIFFATTQGIRFVLLLTPVIAIGVGLFVQVVWSNLISNATSPKRKLFSTTAIVVLALIFVGLFPSFSSACPFFPSSGLACDGYQNAYNQAPMFDDAWYNTLTHIKENSNEDAIITSWWDFGHWFRAIAQRGVIFDGAMQGVAPTWVGEILHTNDEAYVVGALRMLTCGSGEAPHTLSLYLGDSLLAVNTIKEILPLSREEKSLRLTSLGLSDNERDLVLEQLHCQMPPESFVIASEDMVGKAPVWGHFGTWNFTRSQMILDVKGTTQQAGITILQEKFNLSEELAREYYVEIQTQDPAQWISPWPGYLGGSWFTCRLQEGTANVACPLEIGVEQRGAATVVLDGYTIPLDNVENTKVSISVRQNGVPIGQEQQTPSAVVIVTEDGYDRYDLSNATYNFAILLQPLENGQFRALIADPLLIDSLFTKLFFLNGHGLEHFELVNTQSGVYNQEILTYKVDWNGMGKVNNYYTDGKVLARHILVCGNGHERCMLNQTKEEALEQAESIVEQVTAENFAALAAEHSVDASAENGGTLGWLAQGETVPAFQEALFSLEEGEISDIVESPFGYHIIYAEQR